MNSQLSIGNLITVGNMRFHDIEGGFGKDKRAMLAKEIAEIHGKTLDEVNRAIGRNRKWFHDGKDIIDLKRTEFVTHLVSNGIYSQNGANRSSCIYLLSERGYVKLLKIMDDDLAWEKYDQLVDGYFQMRQTIKESPEILESAKRYTPKATSLGEVASFLKIMRSIMKENGQLPEKIAEMAETVCKQFNVKVPENFVRRNPFEQTSLFNITANIILPPSAASKPTKSR